MAGRTCASRGGVASLLIGARYVVVVCACFSAPSPSACGGGWGVRPADGLVRVVSPAQAAGWDVCRHGCRYDQLGPALVATRDGDTIRIGPGVYTGGLTITTSVTLVGPAKEPR